MGRNTNLIILGLIFLIILLPAFPINEVFSQKNPQKIGSSISEIGEESVSYDVYVLLTHVGKIDRKVGEYELDFWLALTTSDGDFTKEKPKIDFVNGNIDKLSHELIQPNYYEAFVQGTFFNEMDFHDFPFEKLAMTIEIEPSAPGTVDKVILNVDPDSGIDSAAKILGWIVSDVNFEVRTHTYDETEEFYRYVALFTLEHSAIRSFFNTFFPAMGFLGVSLISFWVPKNFSSRIYLTMLPLVSLTFWHSYILNTIPTVGYLTIFDKVMIPVYVLFVNGVLSVGIQMRLDHLQKPQLVEKTNKIMRALIPILGVGIFLAMWNL